MKNPGIYILQTFNRKRISLSSNPLLSFIGILAINILKADGMDAGKYFHFNAVCPQIIHHRHLAISQGGDKLESFRTQVFDGMRKIERGSSGHVHSFLRSNYFIQSNISDTTKIVFHKIFSSIFQTAKIANNYRFFPLQRYKFFRFKKSVGLSPNCSL